MSDLINRRDAIIIASGFTFTSHNERKKYMDFLHYCLSNAKTIETEESVCGKWIETHEHKWKKDERGEIDEFSWFRGYCNGVTCEICGEQICVHCHPEWRNKFCYEVSYKCSICGAHEVTKSNYCRECGAKMEKDVK